MVKYVCLFAFNRNSNQFPHNTNYPDKRNNIRLLDLHLYCFYFQQNPINTEADERDLLQLALDRICEMQRKLTQRDSCATGNFLEDVTGRSST